MAAAEARAVWQRTANRYFIQEDAKRATTKIASISSAVSKLDSKPINPADLYDSFPLPIEQSFYSNHSSDSKWWLQLQPDYMYQRGLTNEQVNPNQFVENQDDSSISSVNSRSSKESYEFVQMAEKDDLYKRMHSGLEPQKVKCGQKDISQGESRHDTTHTSKTKILEALCHSQTRAREAEVAAKKAYMEKEHAIKLMLKQASQLFAYRQWIYVLQMENICYQNKNNKSGQMPSVYAFSPSKIGKLDKNSKKVAQRKGTKHGVGQYAHDLGKYAAVFVVGLGIVGAGLVLGWTLGWMLI